MNKVRVSLCAIILLLQSCTSDNGEPGIDCGQNDLQIEISEKIDPGCETGGSISVSASGGTGSLNFTINEEESGTKSEFTDLQAGLYKISVIDENGCDASVETSLVSSAAISVEIETSGCGANDGEIMVNASGGDGNFQYSLNNGDFVEQSVFSNLSQGEYSITVEDGSGCRTIVDKILIGVSLEADIMPIISENCATSGCHGNTQSPLLNTKGGVIAAAERVKIRTSNGTMPPNGQLSEDAITAISNWVDCGALDN